jgi:hypothetical protein
MMRLINDPRRSQEFFARRLKTETKENHTAVVTCSDSITVVTMCVITDLTKMALLFIFFFFSVFKPLHCQIPETSQTWDALSPDGTMWSARNGLNGNLFSNSLFPHFFLDSTCLMSFQK